jgi:polyisoprenoid-binding protein YceI
MPRNVIAELAAGAVLIAIVAWQPAPLNAETVAYRIDPGKSSLIIHVGKAGAFSFIAGHTHEVRGPIATGSVDVDLDAVSRAHLQLVIASSALNVSAAGEPSGDAPKVQAAMQSDKVLDVQRYPKITYESTSVTLTSRRGNHLDLTITGPLKIRDVSQPLTVPVQIELAGGQLSARGRFEITQSAFGIKPVSVGGVVAVKDSLDIEFSIVATK